MSENINENKSSKISLIIITILIILLVFVGIITFFLKKQDRSPENIYYTILDRIPNKLAYIITQNSEIFTNLLSLSGEVKLNFITNDHNLENLANVINNLDISFKNEIDYQNKINNTFLNLNYKNQKLADINLLLENTDGYINLDSIYDKPIKILSSLNDDIWVNYQNDSKIIVEEIFKIIKTNLKKEYFKKENTTLKINNKEVNVNNYIMKIPKEDLNSIQKNIINDILNNSKLLTSLANVFKIDESVIKSNLNNYEFIDFQNDLEINTYLNKENQLEKLQIRMNNLIIVERNNKEYKITKEENNIKTNLGTISIKGTTYNFKLSNVETIFEGNITNKSGKYDFDINVTKEDYLYNISYQTKNNDNKITLKIADDNNNLNLEINYTLDNISKISELNTTNYIEYSMLTSEDITTILSNLSNNEGFNMLSKELNLLTFEPSFGSGTEELN